jgi:hypothetical protein
VTFGVAFGSSGQAIHLDSRVRGFSSRGSLRDGTKLAVLVRILDRGNNTASIAALDEFVTNEIDGLRRLRNPMRGAWLSEMLCHYFPDRYPIKNKPVKVWLAKMKLRGRRGASEGQRYVELAQKLRLVIKNPHPAGARNLAELDGAIWRWVYDRDLY